MFDTLRLQMIQEITADASYVKKHIGKEALANRVMDVMAKVPRHEFVPVELRLYAYANIPLPIGYEKTISQPFIVALMTDLLEIQESDTILEIGTGLFLSPWKRLRKNPDFALSHSGKIPAVLRRQSPRLCRPLTWRCSVWMSPCSIPCVCR